MKRGISRLTSSGRATAVYCICMLLVAAVLASFLVPWGTVISTVENWLKGEEATIVLYTDNRLGEIRGPLFEDVATNTYDQTAFAVADDGEITYSAGGITATKGVDVSVYQGEIDWEAAAADGVEFALIRVGRRGYTEGGIFQDDRFEENIQGALDAGVQVGVYFFSQAITQQEALEEAEQVLEWIDGYDVTYPVIFDWEVIEDSDARTRDITGEQVSQFAAAFCQRVEQAGYLAGVYAGGPLVAQGMDLSLLKEYVFWLVEYHDAPSFYYDFQLWQYTNTGMVDGIEGQVDLNLCFKTW